MPQIFQVLRCYKCMVFQVHQTKKSNKWACKLCGEKQSVKRHYGLGTAKDCRLHVQELNGLRGEIDKSKELSDDEISTSIPSTDSDEKATQNTPKTSKWANFVEETEETIELETSKNKLDDTSNTLDGLEVVLEVPKKKKRVMDKTANKNIINSFTVTSNKSKNPVEDNEIPSCNTKSDVTSKINILTQVKQNNFVNNKKGVKIETISKKVESKNKVEESLVKNNTKPRKPSKWDQYMTDEVENIDKGHEPQNMSTVRIQEQKNINTSRNNTGNMFSLCDDQDIDEVLDF